MAEIGFHIEGLGQLEKNFLKLGSKVGAKLLRAGGRKAMVPVLAAAKSGVWVDTGDLRESIVISVKKGKGKTAITFNVGPTKKKMTKKQGGKVLANVFVKSMAQEYGTPKKDGVPFLRPALSKNIQLVLNTFRVETAKAIEAEVRKLAKGRK